ncbi:MAG: hypothetical protein HY005_00390 [Candidatus Staskawiczbacteria bacterium]|nr:hypothetical protein [Candidatus Staskawiczbacteria bacterium]MBI3337069.1 hypothetical protein [Candidatus Staskawiczbacteria bacterium]
MAVSLYKTTSNNPCAVANVKKIKMVVKIFSGDDKTVLKNIQHYIDPPYLLSEEFINHLQDRSIRCHEVIRDWLESGHPIDGYIANFPHEFHYPQELKTLSNFAKELKKHFGININ